MNIAVGVVRPGPEVHSTACLVSNGAPFVSVLTQQGSDPLFESCFINTGCCGAVTVCPCN